MLICKEDYRFEVDKHATALHYTDNALCDCACCRNFYRQAEKEFPKLASFLAEFGVDISRPDEIGWSDEGLIQYVFVSYSVCGNILAFDQYEIDIEDSSFLSIVADPKTLDDEHFILTVYNISLPFVLDEPRPKEKTQNVIKK